MRNVSERNGSAGRVASGLARTGLERQEWSGKVWLGLAIEVGYGRRMEVKTYGKIWEKNTSISTRCF